jgi:hypothetical protein
MNTRPGAAAGSHRSVVAPIPAENRGFDIARGLQYKKNNRSF